jgi:hypothetical protein
MLMQVNLQNPSLCGDQQLSAADKTGALLTQPVPTVLSLL